MNTYNKSARGNPSLLMEKKHIADLIEAAQACSACHGCLHPPGSGRRLEALHRCHRPGPAWLHCQAPPWFHRRTHPCTWLSYRVGMIKPDQQVIQYRASWSPLFCWIQALPHGEHIQSGIYRSVRKNETWPPSYFSWLNFEPTNMWLVVGLITQQSMR